MGDVLLTEGRFVWRELMTHDVEVAKTFYGGLFGWEFKAENMPNGVYTMIQIAGEHFGGMIQAPMPSIPSHWSSYVSVEDVEASARAVTANGGKVHFGPQDIGVGHVAAVADPAGAVFTLWRTKTPTDTLPERPGPGRFCWETLTTKDKEAAAKFYGAVLGWEVGEFPGGGQGMIFKAGDHEVADVQQSADKPTHWLTYVVVEDAEASRTKAGELGGQIIVPMIVIPHVGKIVLIADPGGAYIGLFEGEKSA